MDTQLQFLFYFCTFNLWSVLNNCNYFVHDVWTLQWLLESSFMYHNLLKRYIFYMKEPSDESDSDICELRKKCIYIII